MTRTYSRTRSSSASIGAANRHLAFGIGEHVCLGAHLARVELETIFRHLLSRLEQFELSGPVERLSSAVNGGIKHLPLRYRLA